MKKIIPFKKEISFNTDIYEISSISLEHNLKVKESNLISGEFIVSGTYKQTETSVNTEPFEYNLPFDISIDKKYNTDNVTVDINDFYYEVNNKNLSVDIEVAIDNLEEKERAEEVKNEDNLKIEIPSKTETSNVENIKNIFDNMDENESYAVYKVHIVTENDTIESILQKYEITKEQLENYNDLKEFKIGDKIIVPANEA